MALAGQLRFQHLRTDEIIIFKRWLILHEKEWEQYDFDVHVGVGVEMPEAGEKYSTMYKRLTQKRIDVVAKRPREIMLIEIRPRTDHTALGNLLAYRDLFLRDFKPTEHVGLLVVSDEVSADDRYALEKNGVVVEIV